MIYLKYLPPVIYFQPNSPTNAVWRSAAWHDSHIAIWNWIWGWHRGRETLGEWSWWDDNSLLCLAMHLQTIRHGSDRVKWNVWSLTSRSLPQAQSHHSVCTLHCQGAEAERPSAFSEILTRLFSCITLWRPKSRHGKIGVAWRENEGAVRKPVRKSRAISNM